ncbi:T9SS type A sorting domain-containing protein [Aurantibacter sp.]|uniref:T9SS type A sorting domain-containing protein n=1 Tax=Aurantibacter sp. TaxID=2807103 RepID=UPI0032647A14
MMKTLLTFLLIFITLSAVGQTIAKNAVSSAGIILSNDSNSFSFTIGEPIVGLIAGDESIDQGFWAGSLFVEAITEDKDLGGIVIYPSPMDNQLNIQTNNNPIYGVTLFTVNGIMALKQKVATANLEHQIDVSHLASGVYVLRLAIENEQEEKLFKVIKK